MIICVDLGATNIKVALVQIDGNVHTARIVRGVTQHPTNAQKGHQGVILALKGAIASYICDDVNGIAISSAGDVDSELSKITYATDNLPGMTGFDFVAFCRDNFHLPCRAINDGYAALLGELVFGCGKNLNVQKTVMLTLGSGVGGAYSVDGKIVANSQNDYARFGHVCLHPNGKQCTCGKQGCVETYLSGRAIHAEAQKFGCDGDDLFQKYLSGAQQNVAFVESFRYNLKLALDKIQQTSPFDVCIIGGGVSEWVGEAFAQVFGGLGYNIIPAELGNSAGIFGALVNYLDGEQK